MENTVVTGGKRVRAPDVMVSYSSHDRERVMEFVRALRAAGVAVWIDQGGIDGAQRWSEEIVNAIEACRIVLLFISRTSMESQNIGREVALAWENGKDFLPIALEEAKIPKSMQYQLAGIQYVKLYEGDSDAKFESVLRALVRMNVRVSPYSMAVVSAGLGDRDEALAWLAKACEEQSGGLARIKTEPRFSSMRSDPRFVELVKRAEAIAVETEDASSEVVLPQPLTQGKRPAAVAATSIPAWKKWLWPDVVDDKSARAAAAQGVWASLAIVAAWWTFSYLVPTAMMTRQTWWDDPIVLTVTFAIIGFGVQKMARPAAALGALLSALSAWGNLTRLSTFRAMKEMQDTYNHGQSFSGQADYSALYHVALFGVIAGIAFVIAFVNAVRGTLAYRSLVLAGRAADKQEALNPADRLAIKRRVMGTLQRAWGMVPASWTSAAWTTAKTTAKKITTAASSVRREPIPFRAPTRPAPVPPAPVVAETAAAVGELQPVYAASAAVPLAAPVPAQTAAPVPVPASAIPAIDQFPTYDDAPEVVSLADLIGSKPFRWTRALAFLAANIAMGLIFMLSRSVVLGNSLHAVYWKYALWHGIAMTLATLVAFRFFRKGWVAAAVASAGTLILVLPVLQVMLLTFHGADLVYREEFQEFILVPFFDVSVTLIGLYYLLPRVRPLALGLWVGAACAEVATSMLIITLRDLGAGAPPDKVLYGALAFFVGVRSLAFAAVFWGGLKLAGIGRKAS